MKPKNKYSNKQRRLQNWDYRWAAAYFITIVTDDRKDYFGYIKDGKMILSNIGVLADVFLHEIKNHSKNTELGEFIVMPNHIHLILILNGDDSVDNVSVVVDARHALHQQRQNRFQNIGKNSVSSIIGSYKSAVTKHARRLGYQFAWQRRFHDHIIWDKNSYHRITNYIINNPSKWEEDKFNGNE